MCDGLPEGPARDAREWRQLTFDSVDDQTREEISGALDLYEGYEQRVAAADPDAVLLVKSHEFDANLADACHARVVLTSNRKESDVFESAAKLKWFTPDVFGAARFERLNDVWQKWRRCWMETADDSGTRVFDLDSVLLEEEYSFREQMWRLTKMLAESLDLGADVFDLHGVVSRVFERDFTMISTPVSPPDTASTDSTRRETGRAAALIRRGRPSERVHGVDVWSIDASRSSRCPDVVLVP